MIDAGVLAGRNVELIEGDIIEMVPEGPEHTYREETLADRLRNAVGRQACVRVAKPITLSDSEPEPDIAIAQGSHKTYAQRHPSAQNLLLVVEISSSTLSNDLTRKRDLYARAEVPEYWVVDLQNRRLEVFRSPSKGVYRERRFLENTPNNIDEAIAPEAFPECLISSRVIFS